MQRRTLRSARTLPPTSRTALPSKALAIMLCLVCSLCVTPRPAFADDAVAAGSSSGSAAPATEAASDASAPATATADAPAAASASATDAPAASDAAATAPTMIPGSVEKIADPSTAASWKALFAGADGTSFSTDDAGRLWVDKSVYASVDDAVAAGVAGPSMQDADLDFLVGMSAFSSSASFRKEQTTPHDVVFVISLNSTLSSFHYDGRTYAEHLADALNEAIGRLMAENSDGEGPADPTRVAVVGYNIDTTVLMPLGTYRPDADGDYVRYDPGLTGGAGFRVTASPDDAQGATLDAPFKGYAYLQRAISTAGDVLEQAATGATADSPRAPEMVVMGSQVAACANTDIADPPPYGSQTQGDGGFLGTLPTGHSSGYGTDVALATLLTMQDAAKRVDAAYAAAGESLSLYTVGLDTQSLGAYVLQTAEGQADAYVAGTGAAQGTNLCDNIDAARAAYAQAAAAGQPSVTLQLFSAGKRDLEARDIAFPDPIPGLLDAADGYAFRGATEYFPATDAGALDGSFNAAVDRILGITYRSPVDPSGDAASSPTENRIRFQDDLGHLMQVKHIEGIQFQGKILDGSLAAKALCTSFADPWDIEAYHELQYLMNSLEARYDLDGRSLDLLYDAYAAGQIAYDAGGFSNFAAWYVDADHGMVLDDGLPYTFAGNDEISAARSGTWRDDPASEASQRIQAAKDAGASAICQTYFFIGNLENQYSGADVPLYDFIVMVETSLDTSDEALLFTAPADSIPARKASITERLDGTTTMMLAEDAAEASPLQVVFEVGPRDDVAALARRVQAGEQVDAAEMGSLLEGIAPAEGTGSFSLLTNAYAAGGDATGGGGEAAGTDGGGSAAGVGGAMSALAASTNARYLFAEDAPLFQLREGCAAAPDGSAAADQLEPLSSAPRAGETVYYEDLTYSADGLEPGVAVPVEAQRTYLPLALDDQSAAACFAGADGRWSVAAGTPKESVPSLLEDVGKSANPTATAPFSLRMGARFLDGAGHAGDAVQTGGTVLAGGTADDGQAGNAAASGAGRLALSARLGNDGALVLTPAREATGSLALTKHVESATPDAEDPFGFSIELSDAEGAPLSGSLTCTVSDGTGGATSESLMLDDEGCLSVSLSDGQTATIDGIPQATRYRIDEEDLGSRYFVLKDNAEGVIGAARAEASFTNIRQAGSLGVAMIVGGNAADKEAPRSFAVTIDGLFDHAAADTVELTLPVTRYLAGGGTEEGSITFMREAGTDVGTATIADFHHNEGVLIENLSSSSPFSVRELDCPALLEDGYAIYTSTGDAVVKDDAGTVTGTLSPDATMGAYFINVKNAEAGDDPAEPGEPDDPPAPGEPDDPDNPPAPGEPDDPDGGDKPGGDEPGEPEDPGEPGDGSNPDTPGGDTGSGSGDADTPGDDTPDEPGDAPDEPGGDVPDNPGDDPDNPPAPDEPDDPDDGAPAPDDPVSPDDGAPGGSGGSGDAAEPSDPDRGDAPSAGMPSDKESEADTTLAGTGDAATGACALTGALACAAATGLLGSTRFRRNREMRRR